MTEAELHKKLKYEKRRDAIGRILGWIACLCTIAFLLMHFSRYFYPTLYRFWTTWQMELLALLLISAMLCCIIYYPGFRKLPVSNKGEYSLKQDGLFYLSRKKLAKTFFLGVSILPTEAEAVLWLPFSEVKGILISNGSCYATGRHGYYNYLTQKNQDGKKVIIPWISLFDKEPEPELVAWWEKKDQHKKIWEFYHGIFAALPGEYLRNLEAENQIPAYYYRRYDNKDNWDEDTNIGFLYGFPLSEAFLEAFCRQYQGTYYIAQSVLIQHSDEMARLIKDFGIEKERIHVVRDMEFADGEKEI